MKNMLESKSDHQRSPTQLKHYISNVLFNVICCSLTIVVNLQYKTIALFITLKLV
jgi:hypothetical protein